MPRFVLLRHEMPAESARPTHYDLMLEQEGVFRTWACERIPILGAGNVLAQQLADHRLAYLTYEGPVSGNRGSVTRIDAGNYELLSEAASELRLSVAGNMLRGILTLKREGEDPQRWLACLASE